MPAARSLIRIAVNVAIDGALAAVAVPVAWWITDPAGAIPSAPLVVPLGVVTLLLAGSAVPVVAAILALRRHGRSADRHREFRSGRRPVFAGPVRPRVGAAQMPGFPLAHGLALLALLGAPRVAYRWFRSRGRPRSSRPDATSVLVVGQTEDCDLFLRALGRDRRQRSGWKVCSRLGDRQTGRRIQGYPILGAMKEAGAVLERLRDDGTACRARW